MAEKSILDPQVAEITTGFLRKAGFSDLSEEMQAEYVEKIGLEIQRRIGIISLEKLSTQDRDELEKIMAKNPKMSDAVLNKYFKEHIKNFEEVLAEELKVFLDEYIKMLKSL